MHEPVKASSEVRLLLARLEKRFAVRAHSRAPEISEERWAFRMAAAVITSFELATLRPWRLNRGDKAWRPTVLLPDVVESPGETNGRHMLTTQVRGEALRRLGSRENMRRALEANPKRRTDGFQRLFEQWMLGPPPALEPMTYEELTWTVQIIAWLDGVLSDLPRVEEVREAYNRRSVYALFEHLAAKSFTGRETELAQLRELVGVLDPTTRTDAVRRQLRRWTGLAHRPLPIVIEGRGGVGKSALLARFLVEHLNVEPERRFPFAYLAMDSPTLRVEEPFTLIAECSRQLQLLQPAQTEEFAAFNAHLAAYRENRDVLEQKMNQARSRVGRSALLSAAEHDLYGQFADLINRLSRHTSEAPHSGPTVPFLLVLDTFEEAIYRGKERMTPLFVLLDSLQKRCPGFRLVISLRPPFVPPEDAELRFDVIPLTDLPADAALLLLERLGVAHRDVAQAVARQVGGNPLNLKLAARLLESERAVAGGIRELKTSSWLFFPVSEEIIRGQLYRRLLGHIHDHRVRRLAHPGMVLRRVSAEAILEVLSGPCDVPVDDLADAENLCEALAREHTLLQRDPDGALRFRPDIRQPTLKLLQRDKPKQVRAIHEAAVEHYHRRSAAPDKAEELYHRLSLDQHAWQLDKIWSPELTPFLASSLDELPSRAQAWLASRLGFDLSVETRERASVEDWEAIVGRKIRDTLRFSDAKRAMLLLQERQERSANSPLFALEAKARMLIGELEPAAAIVRRGIESMSPAPNRGRLAELFWVLAQVCEAQRRPVEADDALARAEAVARGIADPLCQLQILIQRLLLHREAQPLHESAEPIRERLAAQVAKLGPADIDRERSLARAAIALLGPSYADVFNRVLRDVGMGVIENGQRRRFVAAIRAALRENVGAASEMRPLLDDLESESRAIDSLLPYILRAAESWPALQAIIGNQLAAQTHSLAAANLAGIDDYREAWEFEIASELS